IRPTETTWTVTRHRNEIALQDRVYLWRAQGKARRPAGIVAEAEVIEPTRVRHDDSISVRYWRDPRNATPKPRTLLRIKRVAQRNEMLKREWLIDDPILGDLTILRMANATNYRLL